MPSDTGLVLLGVALLWCGGEALVRGAVALARQLGLSPLVIGMTVVSFGTSAPELAATLAAAFRGSPEVAFGNVVGSNIANLGLILGLTALLWPLATGAGFLKREVPFMLGSSMLLFPVALNGRVSRFEGAMLFAILLAFLVYTIRRGGEADEVEAEYDREYGNVRYSLARSAIMVAAGVALLVFGAQALVAGGVSIASRIGISERVIGLTLVALGTSLPELAACIVAALRREGDIVLGNVVGSNIFNVLCILGLTPMVHPLSIDGSAIGLDLTAMLILSLLVWPFLATNMRLERWEGFALVALYGLYMGWLFR